MLFPKVKQHSSWKFSSFTTFFHYTLPAFLNKDLSIISSLPFIFGGWGTQSSHLGNMRLLNQARTNPLIVVCHGSEVKVTGCSGVLKTNLSKDL